MHQLKVPPPKPSLVPPSPLRRIDCLTGLRFVAALLVFIHHLDGHFGVEGTGLPLANNAVSFFFVLSGFILTLVYGRRFESNHRRAENTSSLTADIFSFLKKRVARLWPLHFVCLLVCVATVRYLNLDFWVVVSNLFLVHSWTSSAPYVTGLNNVSWSISTELFFCFAFPIFVIGGYRRFLWRYGFLILATLGCLIVLNFAIELQWISRQGMTLTIQANPIMRLFEFATGILTAYLFTRAARHTNRSPLVDTAYELGTVGLLIVWWVFIYRFEILKLTPSTPLIGNSLGTWIWFCSTAPLFGLTVWTFARSNGLFAKAMASPVMVHLGEISFAFYMIHMIIIRVIDFEGSPLLTTGVLAIALALVASLAAAELLYQLVEMPSKDGMNALLNGGPVDSITKTTSVIRDVLFKPLTGISALALLAVVGIVHQNSLTKYEQARVSQIAQKSSAAHKQVDFDDAAKLLGCLLEIDEDSITIELAWKAAGQDTQKRRTVYLMDQNMEPLKTEIMPWHMHNSAASAKQTYDSIKFDRSDFPNLLRIMLTWEKDGDRATLSKDGQSSSLSLLELHCVDPEMAAIDTLSLPPGKLRSLIEQMPQKQPCIRIGENATLCGYECLPNPDGSLSVNLAWKLKPELTERRVLNFLDENTAVVGNYGDVAMLQFVRREMTGSEEKLFLDELLVPPEKCQSASTITLGLWDEQAKQMVRIENGKTLANSQRLIIGRLNAAD